MRIFERIEKDRGLILGALESMPLPEAWIQLSWIIVDPRRARLESSLRGPDGKEYAFGICFLGFFSSEHVMGAMLWAQHQVFAPVTAEPIPVN